MSKFFESENLESPSQKSDGSPIENDPNNSKASSSGRQSMSSLTSSRGSGSRSSQRSGSSQKITNKALMYFKHYLFKGEDANIQNIALADGGVAISRDHELESFILSIKERESEKIKHDPKSAGAVLNNILASFVCYKKGGSPSAVEIKVSPIPDMTEIDANSQRQYTEEVKKSVFEFEKESTINAIEKKLGQLDGEFLTLEGKGISEQMSLELLCDRNLKLAEAKSRQINHQFKSKEPSKDELVEKTNIELMVSELRAQINSYLQDSDYQRDKKRMESIEIEQTYCQELQKPEVLDQAIGRYRGHSEDYLYYLMHQDQFIESIKRQIPEGSERIYLLIFSTRDACERCGNKVEQITNFLNEKFQYLGEKTSAASALEDSEAAKSPPCKVLYFANQRMADLSGGFSRTYQSPEDGSLSDYEGAVINLDPLSSRFCSPAPAKSSSSNSGRSSVFTPENVFAAQLGKALEEVRVTASPVDYSSGVVTPPRSIVPTPIKFSPDRLFDNIPPASLGSGKVPGSLATKLAESASKGSTKG